jgi:DNA recombination protein RmuC
MIEILLITGIILLIINGYLAYQSFRKGSESGLLTLQPLLDNLDKNLVRAENSIKDEFSRNRQELTGSFKMLGDSIVAGISQIAELQKNQRDELAKSLKSFEDQFRVNVIDLNNLQKQKFDLLSTRQAELVQITEQKLDKMRDLLEAKLTSIQDDNSKKLEQMRATVDEKLQETVDKRFNESFKMISERLEQVHKGLGEMQTLASGVGDLKKVLSNVKTRGILGEIQLGSILEQVLSVEQYETNIVVKEGSNERVEYAIKLPGKDKDGHPLLLPIDSKFPIEDYHRLVEAYDHLSPKEIDDISKQFETAVKKNAKDIREKYINPPFTTDFAIMFVPAEGLYAEILRRRGLFEILQRDYNVAVVGPSNLLAFLNSLQMGFRTLVIEKRSSEVWELLGAVKTEFGNFGTVLEKTKKKLEEATSVIDKAGIRSRAIERKLKSVQGLPKEDSIRLIGDALEIEAALDEEGKRDEED